MSSAACAQPDAETDGALAGRGVVHLVGRADARMVDHLAVMTRLLLRHGLPQTVVLFDETRLRSLLPRFDSAVRPVLAGGSRWRMPGALLRTLHDEVARVHAVAVHAHGLSPCLLGIFAARFLDLRTPLHVTFHGRQPGRTLARALSMLWSGVAPAAAAAPLAQPVPIEWIECEVDDVFFGTTRREARRPLLVTASGDLDARHAARFAQLAVLLESTGLAFDWLGPANGAAAAQFANAGVGHYEARLDAERAERLRSAWLYVGVGDCAVSTPRLAEAMASGLPCIAWNTAPHRALLEHGRTGLLCDSEEGLLDGIALLVDSSELRARLGRAARAEAVRRFSPIARSASLVASYRAAAAHRLAA